ncbi:MAG: hypothetical protein AAF739_06030 [Pseudomonadota bacterium]
MAHIAVAEKPLMLFRRVPGIAVRIVALVAASTLCLFALNAQPVSASEAEFAKAVEICLDHLVDKDPTASFEERGYSVVPADEGTFNVRSPGWSGFLAPLLLTEWCWIESDSLSQSAVAALAYELVRERYPSGGAGPAERGTLANDCPSTSFVYAGQRIAMLEFRNAGFWNGCREKSLGGVLFH